MYGCGQEVDAVLAALCVGPAVEQVVVGVEDVLGDGVGVVVVVSVLGGVVE